MTCGPSVNKRTSTLLSWNSRLHCTNWIHYQPSRQCCLSLYSKLSGSLRGYDVMPLTQSEYKFVCQISSRLIAITTV